MFPRPALLFCALQEVLDWFEARHLKAYSISAGQSLLYNDIFPKHKERLGKKMSELVVSCACTCAAAAQRAAIGSISGPCCNALQKVAVLPHCCDKNKSSNAVRPCCELCVGGLVSTCCCLCC